MCEGFGMIISKDLKGYFTVPDKDGNMSHSEILKALGWKDSTSEHVRNFVRIQCPDWNMKSFEFDESSTLPGWAENNVDEIKQIVKKALRRCATALAEYKNVCATAWARFEDRLSKVSGFVKA